MNTRVDLHLHTTASDGRWSPAQLFENLKQAGIGLFSVTDHDSLGSLAPTFRLVKGSGLRFLAGVELSAKLNGQLYHILAYGFDPGDDDLNALVAANTARLDAQNDAAVRLLAESGYPVSLEDYEAYTWDRGRGGWKTLNYCVDLGLCSGVSTYFGELFAGELAHPESEFPPPEAVMAVARGAGGFLVLAHPGAPFYNGLNRERLDDLVDMGLQGLEAYSFHHNKDETHWYLDYAQSRGLLVTGGSDCHGGFAGRALGVPPVSLSDLELGPLLDRVVG